MISHSAKILFKMKIKFLLIAGVMATLFSSCGSDCDPNSVVWVGIYSGNTECFDTTTVTEVIITPGNTSTEWLVAINDDPPLTGFSSDCDMQMPVIDVQVSQLESARKRWEISIDGNKLNYKESATSSISGIAVSCEGILTRQ